MSKSLLKENINRISKETLLDFYIEQNHTKKEVCDKFGITMSGLSLLLKHYEIVKDKSAVVMLRKQTNLKKYGVDNPAKSVKIKEKISKANKSLNKEEVTQKRKATKLAKYGNENYCNIEQGKLTKELKYGSATYNNREKSKQTTLKHYGVDTYFKSEECRSNNAERMLGKADYTEEFKEIFHDRDAAIAFLDIDKKFTLRDLCDRFNCSYCVVQMWVSRMQLQEYINFSHDGVSYFEEELYSFLVSELGIANIIKNTTNVLGNGQEIDLYLPDFKVGIEFNGTYWHSDVFKEQKYHLNKSLIAESKGIHLIHIYEYEWLNPIFKNKLKCFLTTLLLHNTVKKVYARNCTIRQISNKESSALNNSNHFQNHRDARLTYGLFYKNELIQLMSFSKHKKYEWEIIRSCSKANYLVVGGVSRLFTQFIRDNNPNQIFSYCDFNKFTGISYEKLGMKFIGNTVPDMKYIIGGQVVNRQPSNYQELKNKFDARIYGAGSKKYLWERQT